MYRAESCDCSVTDIAVSPRAMNAEQRRPAITAIDAKFSENHAAHDITPLNLRQAARIYSGGVATN